MKQHGSGSAAQRETGSTGKGIFGLIAGEKGIMNVSDKKATKENGLAKIFLSERFMAAICVLMAAAGIVSLVFCFMEKDSFETQTRNILY